MDDTRPKKVVLALGSGASRGWAHIGVIEALEEESIPVHGVAGCSVGGFIGAIYASGKLEELKKYVLENNGKSMFSFSDLALLKSGMLDGDKKIKELFCRFSDKKTFEEFEVPLKVIAADMYSGDPVILDEGDILLALRATMSYPGLFEPVAYKNRWLIDGGVVDPVPCGVARAMGADIVISVNLNSELVSKKFHQSFSNEDLSPKNSIFKSTFLNKITSRYNFFPMDIIKKNADKSKAPGMMESINAAISVMQDRITTINSAVNRADIIIEPRLGDLKMLDYDQVEHAIEEGYIAAKSKIDDIRVLFEL